MSRESNHRRITPRAYMYLAIHLPHRITRSILQISLLLLISAFVIGCGQEASTAPYGSDADAATKGMAAVDVPPAKEIKATTQTEDNKAPDPSSGSGTMGAETVFANRACGACHMVSDIPSAVGTIGPDLDGVASRELIAETLETSLDNFKTWLADPAAVKPGTEMPTLGLGDDEIEVLANWLVTLK